MGGSASSRLRRLRSRASCASRSASTCARGRESRRRSPTNTRSTSPIATTAGSRAPPPRKRRRSGRRGRRSATASTARNAIFVRLSDGALRNAYTVRISNKRSDRREFALSLSGLPGSLLDVVQTRDDGRFVVEVGPDQTREVRVLVTDYVPNPPASTPITFH